MTDYTALKLEIADLKYNGKTDADIAVMVNAKTVAARRPVPIDEIRKFMIRRGILGAAKVVGDDQQADRELRIACITARDSVIENVFVAFDYDDPTQKEYIDQFIGSLIAAQCMSEKDRDDLLKMADYDGVWTIANQLPTPVNEYDVDAARRQK